MCGIIGYVMQPERWLTVDYTKLSPESWQQCRTTVRGAGRGMMEPRIQYAKTKDGVS